jgi:hypothetical protein
VAPEETSQETPPLPPAKGSAPDVETLKLVYAELQRALESEDERRRSLLRTLATLPASAGAVLALFIAVRPDKASALVSVLYAIGLVPFVLIVLVSLALASPRLFADPRSSFYAPNLTAEDSLPIGAWLERQIIASRWRLWTAYGEEEGVMPRVESPLDAPGGFAGLYRSRTSSLQVGPITLSPYQARLRGLALLQVLFGLEVVYLVVISAIAPFLD